MTPRAALLSLHAAVLMFGLSGLIGKSVSSPAVVVTCLRSLIGAVALGILLWHVPRSRDLLSVFRGRSTAMLVGGALLACHWCTFFMAIQLGTVALGLLTYASYPLFVTILNWLLQRESVRGKDWLAAVAVLIGLGLVVPDWNFGSQAGLASALGLVSGFTFALLTLLNRHLIRDVSPLPLVTVQMAIAGFVLLPLAAPQIFQVTVEDWFWLSLLGVVFTGIAHACFTSSLKTVRVAAVSVAAALEPVYGMLAAAIFLREMPTILMLIGAAFIIGASFISLLQAPQVENVKP